MTVFMLRSRTEAGMSTKSPKRSFLVPPDQARRRPTVSNSTTRRLHSPSQSAERTPGRYSSTPLPHRSSLRLSTSGCVPSSPRTPTCLDLENTPTHSVSTPLATTARYGTRIATQFQKVQTCMELTHSTWNTERLGLMASSSSTPMVWMS